jgi:hypothetical protein
MIRWEAPLREVACSDCGSNDTEVSFEFLAFTHRICRSCGATFVTIGDPSRDRKFPFPFRRQKAHEPKPR